VGKVAVVGGWLVKFCRKMGFVEGGLIDGSGVKEREGSARDERRVVATFKTVWIRKGDFNY